MKIKIGKENVVAQGPEYEKSYWGEFQFPQLYKTTDGGFAIRTHCARDQWEDYGRGKDLWSLSEDGANWKQISNGIAEDEIGTLLPNGDRIYFPAQPSIVLHEGEFKDAKNAFYRLPTDVVRKEEDGSFPYPVYSFKDVGGTDMQIYDFDTLPDGVMEKTWKIKRIKNGENISSEESVPVEMPYWSARSMVIKDKDGKRTFAMLKPYPLGPTKIDKDGNIWIVSYTGHHLNPFTKAVDRCSAVMLFKSTDNGYSFKLQSYIPYRPDPGVHPTAYYAGGFTEADMEFMDDGSIIVVMRTACIEFCGPEWNPMYITRSTDGGVTFSEPEEFTDMGVHPQLCKLGCGVTLLTYGRPGIFIKATEDSSGMEWSEPVEIMTPGNRSSMMNIPPERPTLHQWTGSCCNVFMKPIDDNHALIAYSDFFYPDVSGKNDKKLKTILTRIITVEKD